MWFSILLASVALQQSSSSSSSSSSSTNAWSGPSLSVTHSPGPDALPMLQIKNNDGSTTFEPSLWITLHTYYLQPEVFEYQINQTVAAGLRVVCICLTGDNDPVKSKQTPWYSASTPMENRTQAMLFRVIELHPQVVFVIRFYAEQADIPSLVRASIAEWQSAPDVARSTPPPHTHTYYPFSYPSLAPYTHTSTFFKVPIVMLNLTDGNATTLDDSPNNPCVAWL
jgi:hypothetical protein